MQTSIVKVAWLLLDISGPWKRYFRRLRSSISNHVNQSPQWDDQEMLVNRAGRPKRKWATLSDQPAILKSMLVEFQEAQCFFMLASQAAVLMTLHNGTIVFGAKSFSQLSNNYWLVGVIGMGGALPPTFALFTLCRFDMFSWYILVFTGVTIATATASSIEMVKLCAKPFTRADLQPVAGVSRLDACGGNPPPTIYCNQRALATSVTVIPLYCSWMIYLIVVVGALRYCAFRQL